MDRRAPKTVDLVPAPTEVPKPTEPASREKPAKPERTERRPPPPPEKPIVPPMPERVTRTADDLRQSLSRVPEVDLYPTVEKLHTAVTGMKRSANLKDAARLKILSASTSPPEFSTRINTLLLKEARAAGLSVVADGRCRTGVNAAKTMDHISTTLRTQGFLSTGPVGNVTITDPRTGKIVRQTVRRPIPGVPEGQDSCDRFQQWCDQNHVEKYAGSLPTLVQMLQVEDEPLRQLLIRELSKVNSRDASFFLAKRAMFDLSPEVRKAAVEALKKRKPETFRAVFLAGMRYPWAPAADHAAEALVQLKDQAAVPALVRLLDLPDPSQANYNETSKTYSTARAGADQPHAQLLPVPCGFAPEDRPGTRPGADARSALAADVLCRPARGLRAGRDYLFAAGLLDAG